MLKSADKRPSIVPSALINISIMKSNIIPIKGDDNFKSLDNRTLFKPKKRIEKKNNMKKFEIFGWSELLARYVVLIKLLPHGMLIPLISIIFA